jgi:hypothetical protein
VAAKERQDVLGEKRGAGVAYARRRHARSRQDELVLAVGICEVARVDGWWERWTVWFATGSVGGGGGDGGMGKVAHLEIYYATYVHKQGHARVRMLSRLVRDASAWQYPTTETVSHRDANAKSRSREKHEVIARSLLDIIESRWAGLLTGIKWYSKDVWYYM